MNRHQEKVADLSEIIRPAVEALNYEMLGIELQQRGKNSLIRVYIDSAEGIMLSDCEAVSNQVSAVLDVEDPINGHYTLEISSPGLDRPLFEKAHYEKYVGERASVKLQAAIAGQKNFTGTIKAVTENELMLQVDDITHTLSFADIKSGRLMPEDFGVEGTGD